MSMQKKYSIDFLRSLVIYGIGGLSDPFYQKRIWVEGKGPEVDSYDDAITYFSDMCELIFEAPSDYEGINGENLELLKTLYQMVMDYDRNLHVARTPEDVSCILEDPKWHKIQVFARDVFQTFQKVIERTHNGKS